MQGVQNMNTIIEVSIKNVYGNDTIYVEDSNFRQAHRAISGKKTLTISDIEAYKSLGFSFEVKPKIFNL